MSPIEHNGRRYGVIRGNDIQRDGMYLELWSASRPDLLLFEVFFSDVTHQMQFAAFSQECQEEVPIEVVEEFLRQARSLLPPSAENAEQVAAHEPPPPGSGSSSPAHQTLDSLPVPGSSGGR